jgi:hypothetical protein
VTRQKLADNAVGGAQADQASFKSLIQGEGSQTSHTFTAPATGFLPTPDVLAEIPGFGQVRLMFCGEFADGDQIRIQALSFENAPDFIDVSSVHAAALPGGTSQPEFHDFGGGHLSGGGGDINVGQAGGPVGPFGVAQKFDFAFFRGSGPSATTAHISVSGLNDSSTITHQGQCFVSAETVIQP